MSEVPLQGGVAADKARRLRLRPAAGRPPPTRGCRDFLREGRASGYGAILYENGFNLKRLVKEIYCTASSLLVISKQSCRNIQ